jgi:hypothetical protein
MKTMRDRKTVMVDVILDELMSLLETQGLLEWRDDTSCEPKFRMPHDASVVGAAIMWPEKVGHARLRVTLESGQLDDGHRAGNRVWIARVYDSPLHA